jgi:hypothetical protein
MKWILRASVNSPFTSSGGQPEVAMSGSHRLFVWRANSLSISGGKVIRFTAREGEEPMRRRVTASQGDWSVVSEVRVGLHQPCRGLTGVPALDGCLAGIVSLGIGNNELLGGDVASTLNLGLPSRNVTLQAGDATVVREGSLAETL